MSVTPTLNLFVNSDEPQPYYWLDVVVDTEEGYSLISHEVIPTTPSPGEEFHIDVNIQESGDGDNPTKLTIDLGTISLDPNDGEIHIHLLDAEKGDKGNGIVRAEEAQEATKPIPAIM